MAGKIVDGKAVNEDGQNIFHDAITLESLVDMYGGFASMCWTDIMHAGEFKGEQIVAASRAFQERADEIIKARLYEQLAQAFIKKNPFFKVDVAYEWADSLLQDVELWKS